VVDVFIAILVLIGAGLIATTKRAYRIRRSRPVAALVAGGWMSVLIGVLLGPAALDLIDRDAIFDAVPLLAVGLGWIGFLVGLQLRLSVLRALPRIVYRMVAADGVMTLLVFGAIATVALVQWTPPVSAATLLLPVVFIVASSLGWSVETRSLGLRFDERQTVLIRATGALSAVVAIVLFGLATKAVETVPIDEVRFVPGRSLLKLLHSLAVALAIGVVGRLLIRMAGTGRGQQFTVFLGIVAFVAGSAKQLDVSPLITALGAGIVITNIRSAELQEFANFILRAEHTFAILFGLLTGLLLEPVYAPVMLLAALALVLARVLLKPLIFRVAHHQTDEVSLVGDETEHRSKVYLAAARQNPIMLALGVSLVLIEPSPFHKELLGIMVFVGAFAEIITGVAARSRRVELLEQERAEGATS
jgi:hypothetical protein